MTDTTWTGGRRLRWRATLLAGVVLAAPGLATAQPLPRSVLPGLGPAPARQAVEIEQAPWRGVVRVQTELGERCTGALVGSRLVLTAAHCLFGRGAARFVRPSSVHVLSGYRQGAYAGHARAVSIEVGAGDLGADADWAVLTLDTPLGTADRVLPLAEATPPPGTAAMLGGFEQDRPEVLLADPACRITGPVLRGPATLLSHSCAGTSGVSGAPLLVRAGSGWSIAGLAVAAPLAVAGGLAIPATTIAAASRVLPRRPGQSAEPTGLKP